MTDWRQDLGSAERPAEAYPSTAGAARERHYSDPRARLASADDPCAQNSVKTPLRFAHQRVASMNRPLDRLLAIMARLRDPRHGCPWDREQDFATIAPYTIE